MLAPPPLPCLTALQLQVRNMATWRLLRSSHCAWTLLLGTLILLPHTTATQTSPHRGVSQWILGSVIESSEDLYSSDYKQRWKRDMQLMESVDDVGDEINSNDNCSAIHDHPPEPFNDTCQFVKENCGDKHELFNYLRFIFCSLGKVIIF